MHVDLEASAWQRIFMCCWSVLLLLVGPRCPPASLCYRFLVSLQMLTFSRLSSQGRHNFCDPEPVSRLELLGHHLLTKDVPVQRSGDQQSKVSEDIPCKGHGDGSSSSYSPSVQARSSTFG